MLNTIKLGMRNDLVAVAQYLTQYASIKKAKDNFDSAFYQHVIKWQSKNNLVADGIIGEHTWAAMVEQAPTCSTAKNKNSVYTCALQLLLGNLTVDGIYGTKTKNAVAAYQHAQGLVADGICGPKTWKSFAAVVKKEEMAVNADPEKVMNKCVHYLQWDSKWKSVKYSTHTSSQTIGNSGCGPTSMAMIMATFVDKKITPVEMCQLSVDNGYRTYSDGTAWGFYKFVFTQYDKFEKFSTTSSVVTLKAALKQGALAVCSMNNKDNKFWTSAGHFIVAIGYDATYIYANDPNKSTAPRKQEQSKFQTCLKQAFIFWPKTAVAAPVETKASGTKIIDISKWQGAINFAALTKEVGLVIVRAGVGSDPDPKFEEYAKAMQQYGIPFGVYGYSYAGTEAKARDEANKLFARTYQYKPLFYVMDAEEEKINTNAIKAYADELRACGAKKIGCYVAHHRYQAYKYDNVRSLYDFTWIPSYGTNNGTIEGSKKPSYKCDLWQYTSTAKISGINGNVDMNVVTGDGHPYEWFLK